MFKRGDPTRAICTAIGVKRSTLQGWRKQWNNNKDWAPRDGYRARAPKQASELGPADSAPHQNGRMSFVGYLDPLTVDPVEYFSNEHTKYAYREGEATRVGKTKVAAANGKLALEYFHLLAAAVERDRLKREREERAQVRDPIVLAGRILGRLPKLLEMAGDRELAKAIRQGIDEWLNR